MFLFYVDKSVVQQKLSKSASSPYNIGVGFVGRAVITLFCLVYKAIHNHFEI
jgi:hypothetical protein